MENRITYPSAISDADRPTAHLGITLILLWLLPTMFLWGMAFYSAPASTPAWLLRAQSACFGTDSSGLPSVQGWTLLVLAPLSMLAAMICAFGQELIEGARLSFRHSLAKAALVVLLLLLVAEAVWVTKRIRVGLAILATSYSSVENGSLPEHYPRLNKPAPKFELVDQHGMKGGIGDRLQGPIILSFAFAHCTTVCPVIVEEVNKACAALESYGVTGMLITLDPWRDTPSALPSLAKRWQLRDNVKLYSGAAPLVERALDDYAMVRTRDQANGDITHPALVYVISKEGLISYTFNNPPRSWIEEAVKRLH